MKIKTSNKILLAAGTIPILFAIILLVVFKITLIHEGNSQAYSARSSILIANTLLLE